MLSRTVSAAAIRSIAGRLPVTRLLLATFTLLLVSLPALAQSTAGRILGTVTDQSGAAVAGATVVVTDLQRGTSRTADHRRLGRYAAPDLQPGTYKIHVEAKGFKSVGAAERWNRSRHRRARRFRAPAGADYRDGDHRGRVPLVNTTSSTLGGTLSNQGDQRPAAERPQLREPAATAARRHALSRAADSPRPARTACALKTMPTYVEGLFNSEPYSGQAIINGAGIAGDSATILPIDAIQEFNLQQNPPAEYGWKPGAVVNVGLKSGTNSMHGTRVYLRPRRRDGRAATISTQRRIRN